MIAVTSSRVVVGILLVILVSVNYIDACTCGGGCKKLSFAGKCGCRPDAQSCPIGGPHGLATHGNNLYVTGWSDGFFYRFNTQVNGGRTPCEKVKFPCANPTFIDIRGGFVYVTSVHNAVYKKPLIGGCFSLVVKTVGCGAIKPVGIKWSPDGRYLFVGDWQTGKINIYNKCMHRVGQVQYNCQCGKLIRELSFDSFGNLRATNYGNKVCLFKKTCGNRYVFSKAFIIPSTRADGYFVHCDGTMVVTDRARGKVIQLSKTTYKPLQTLCGLGGQIIDVALTSDGTLCVSHFTKRRVLYFKNVLSLPSFWDATNLAANEQEEEEEMGQQELEQIDFEQNE